MLLRSFVNGAQSAFFWSDTVCGAIHVRSGDGEGVFDVKVYKLHLGQPFAHIQLMGDRFVKISRHMSSNCGFSIWMWDFAKSTHSTMGFTLHKCTVDSALNYACHPFILLRAISFGQNLHGWVWMAVIQSVLLHWPHSVIWVTDFTWGVLGLDVSHCAMCAFLAKFLIWSSICHGIL